MPNDIIYGMMILLFITISKKSYGIVDKNILCRIKNIQSYKLVFCVLYFLIFTVSCSSCDSLKSVSRTLFMLHRYSFIHSFIHTKHLYSASSRGLLRGAPDSSTAKKSSLKLRKKRR